MKIRPSYELNTDELKQAIIDYINSRINSEYNIDNVEHFYIQKSDDDNRIYQTGITFGEETV